MWCQTAFSQPAWQALSRLPEGRTAAEVWIRADHFHAVALDHAAMNAILRRALHEDAQPLAASSAVIDLPMPDGSLARFRFVEAPVMAPELAAKFPEIKTYRGEGIDDPAATVRFDLTPAGFHAQILSPHGTVYIDPAFRGDSRHHTSYYKRDHRRTDDFRCLFVSDQTVAGRARSQTAGSMTFSPTDLARSGSNLRTYRLAVAATAEYTAYQGGTVSAGMAAIVTAVNRVTGVYEVDLAIRLVLVANNDLLVYTNSSTDPYSNNNASSLLSQNQANLDSVIGSANYDIGHVFSTAGGGLAALGVVCRSSKAQGETGTSTPTGDGFYIDYVAHEMGHQFGANHTFNSSTGSCGGGNRNGSTAYEQGSGSTIMAYAGICGSDDLQPHSDPYFHSVSFDEILNYSTAGSGNNCAVLTATGNNAPTVSAGVNYTIPQNTPFTLTAIGSDPDGDALTYCWEERDLGPATTITASDNGSSPLFRSWNPTPDPSRTFPRLQELLNNTRPLGEIMPTTTRTMNFRVTARDNRSGGGGVNTSDMQVSVVSSAGPFTVTFPNSAGTLSGAQTITWNVAGTAATPINCANVNILLSTNGGLTFPIVLAANTPNDGSQLVVLPNVNTSSARIKVAAAGNIFFDLSNTNFSIVPSTPLPSVALDSATLVLEGCGTPNSAIDPGEAVTVNFALKNLGTASTTNLIVTLLATNGVTSPGGPQTYGVLTAGGAAVFAPFTFTAAAGACGGTINCILVLQDGTANLGTVNQSFPLGSLNAVTTRGTNAAAIAVPATGNKGVAAPYPSIISVSGVTGAISKVTVSLDGFQHTFPADVDVLLVGPGGQKTLLMSDAGGGNSVSGLSLMFDDDAAAVLPETTALSSGTFKPTDYTAGDTFPAPAPAGSYGTSLAVFNGQNPNGSWSLYVQDDSSKDTGNITQGWRLTIITASPTCCTSVAPVADVALGQSVSSALVNAGSNVTFAISVTNFGPNTASSVTVTDTLPAGLSFVSADSTLGTPVNNGGIVTCALGDMASGDRATITIQTMATTSGLKTNLANTASPTLDPTSANNTMSATLSVNAIPTIDGLTNATTLEDTPIGLAFTIGDAETPASSLTLTSACSNTNLVPLANVVLGGSGTNRTLTVTPATNQSGSATITLTVSDGLADASASFQLTVVAVNDPPSLAAISDRTIHAGSTLTFTNSATDPDVPANALTFSLDAGAPTGAQIDATHGVFTWTPGDADVNTTNSITVRVADDGAPPMDDAKTFLVTVVSRPVITAITVSNDLVTVNWTALEGQTYRLEYLTNLEDTNWSTVPPDVTAGGPNASRAAPGVLEAWRFYRVMLVP